MSFVSVRDKLIGFALKYLKFFEPFAKFGISYYLNRQLRLYRNQGLLAGYRTRVQRLGFWHYRINVSLDLTPSQAVRVFRLVVRRLGRFGR